MPANKPKFLPPPILYVHLTVNIKIPGSYGLVLQCTHTHLHIYKGVLKWKNYHGI